MAEPHAHDFAGLVRQITRTLGVFLRGQTLIVLVLTVFHTAAFWLIDLPMWWFAGIVVGLLTAVPYIGIIVGLLVPLLIVLISAGGWWLAVQVVLVMAGGQALESFYLRPKILGRELDLHPLAVFGLVMFGAFAFGPLGAFLAAPAAAVAALVWRHYSRKRELARRPSS